MTNLVDENDVQRVESAGWWACATVRKWHTDEDYLSGEAPYETIQLEKNRLLLAGINRISNLITGTTTTPYGSASRIGVGDSSTAAVQSQTGLQAATNKAFVTVSGAPTVTGSPAVMQWTAAFTAGVAEWSTGWQEWTVDNGASAGETLNRFVQNLGTKTGGTWTFTISISIA